VSPILEETSVNANASIGDATTVRHVWKTILHNPRITAMEFRDVEIDPTWAMQTLLQMQSLEVLEFHSLFNMSVRVKTSYCSWICYKQHESRCIKFILGIEPHKLWLTSFDRYPPLYLHPATGTIASETSELCWTESGCIHHLLMSTVNNI
jgi:hypothetical protein